jgi:hypothetical protein
VANSCDVNVEHALIDHNHADTKQNYKPDSIRTLSTDVKNKIALLESTGITATKIRRHLFVSFFRVFEILTLLFQKDLQSTGAPLPTLKQIQNYVGRLRIKRPNPEGADSPQIPSTSSVITADIPRNLDGTPKRKRGRPRLSEQRNEVPIQVGFRCEITNFWHF